MKIPMRRVNQAFFPAGEEATRNFEALTTPGLVYEIEAKELGDTYTEKQLDTFWEWMGRLAAHFSRKGSIFNKDDMHDLTCHMFLGYEDRLVGKTSIRALRTLTWPRKTVQAGKIRICSLKSTLGPSIKAYSCPTAKDSEYSTYKEASQ